MPLKLLIFKMFSCQESLDQAAYRIRNLYLEEEVMVRARMNKIVNLVKWEELQLASSNSSNIY